MNRKTNLFYSTGQDSNFVTFSNYTEALTACSLATNTKLFPSKFICMYIPELVKETNEDFIEEKKKFIIKWLSGYYENKLATLRDAAGDEIADLNYVHPTDYLLDTIKNYSENAEITFEGDICEQEYNGTFMDNICIIENNAQAFNYEITTNNEVSVNSLATEETCLHGWAGQTLPSVYYEDFGTSEDDSSYDSEEQGDSSSSESQEPTVKPMFDNDRSYSWSESRMHEITQLTTTSSSIKFNALVPLFRINDGYLDPSTNEEVEHEDMPMGMWFSDKVIELERTDLANYSYRPSWSICISSQFKPFPYSDNYPSEIEEYSNPDKFASFAMIMSKQAYILDEFQSLSKTIESLNKKIAELETSSSNKYSNYSGPSIDTEELDEMKEQLAAISARLEEIHEEEYITTEELSDEIQNVTGFVTSADIESMRFVNSNELSSMSYVTSTDLDDASYISRSELSAQGYLQSVPANYVTDEHLGTASYVTRSELAAQSYLQSVPDNYVTKSELEAQSYLQSVPDNYVTSDDIAGMNFITAEDLDGVGYVSSSALSAYASKTELQNVETYIFGNGANNVSTNGFYKRVETIIDNNPTYSGSNNSVLLSRLKNVLTTGPNMTNPWLNLFAANAGNTVADLRDPSYSIPNIIIKTQQTVSSYEAADAAIMNILTSYGGRLDNLDGSNLPEGLTGIVPALVNAMTTLETRLGQVSSVFTYLYDNLPVLHDLDQNDTLQNNLRTILSEMYGNSWSNIYSGND